jgi:hypothetical protein
MSTAVQLKTKAVAEGRLATSSQPPRAIPSHQFQDCLTVTPYPLRSSLRRDKSGALRVGLLCFTASRPLPTLTLRLGKPYGTYFHEYQAFE